MGSGNSRLGSRPSRSRVNRSTKRRFSSYLMCGGASSSSHAPIHEMDESPAELLACSAEGHNTVNMDEHQRSIKEELSTLCTEIECPRSTLDEPRDRNNAVTVSPAECNTRCIERVNEGKTLSERKELVQLASNDGHSLEPRTQRIGDVGSSSYTEQQSQHSVSNAVIGVDKSKTEGASRIFPEDVCSSSTSHQEPELACAERVLPTENPSNDVLGNHSSDTSSVLTFSDSSLLTSHPLRDTTSQAANTATPGFLMLDSQRDRSGSVLHVDVVSISSGSLFGGTREVSSREARRNSRRLFWDAFSRRSSRRHNDSRTIFFSSEGTDDLGSQDRWLLDFSGDIFEDGVGSDSGYLGNRSHGMSEGRWQSRSEIWDRFRSGLDESSRQTAICATGLHPYGTCSCESFLTGEESSTRGSISRIVMLAEALFEVLDEIHRQPAAFSLSMVSTPAPESIVNSFPLKSYKKLNTAKNGEEIDQCYICLAEYEEEDNIRVLPCHHEYHMACVDKWLKEIHGVCPLCRGDVCAGGVSEGTVSNPA